MSLFGGDFGISEFIIEKLGMFEESLSKPAQKKISNFIRDTVILFSIAGPALTIPQVFKIYAEKSASSLSPITWVAFLFLATFWLAYGVFIKNKPIVLANFLWIIIHVLMITGIYMYG